MDGVGKAVFSLIFFGITLLKQSSCQGDCRTEYTSWNGAGGGDAVYLDRHRINCGGDNNVLKEFALERSGDNIRYRYICCRFANNGNLCKLRQVFNGFTNDGDGDIVYLDRQHVHCQNGALNELKLVRNGGHDQWRYEYFCCDFFHEYISRLSCFDWSTGFTYDGDGKNYYLDRQTVSCGWEYFLQSFQLNRNSNHDNIRYTIKCCKVV